MKKIVIYHYNQGLRNSAADALRQAGYVTYAAAEPEAAYRAASALPADIVLTAFPALFGTTGVSLTEAVRGDPQLANTPVLNVCTATVPELLSTAAAAGVSATITSSFTPRRIVEAVHRWCERAAS